MDMIVRSPLPGIECAARHSPPTSSRLALELRSNFRWRLERHPPAPETASIRQQSSGASDTTPGTFVPFLAVMALLLPLPFFLRQSFLQLGDVEVVAMLAVLQWMIVLAAWDLVPLRLWR